MVDHLKDVFISESGKYFLQKEDGSYRCIHERLTDDIIKKHLNKEITLGIPPKSNSTTKWICFDVDSRDFNIVSSIVGTLEHHNIKAEIEDSGNKGYHVWIFFKGNIENIFSRRFAKFIIDETDLSDDQRRLIEIFPKQDVITGVGSCIKLPWGIHRATGKETHFVNRIPKPISFDEWYQKLKKVEPQLIKDILEMNNIKVDVNGVPQQVIFKTPKEIKPCVIKYIEDGVEEGERNKIGFIIATEKRRVGNSKEETIHYLINWNRKNKPFKKPYTEQEIFNTVNSAYGEYHKHEYGCNNRDLQRNCVGRGKCEYHHKLKRMNPSTGRGFDKKMFYKLGWQRKLNGSQNHMYISVLPLLEEEKNIAPGDWLFTKYSELSHYLGKASSHVNKTLEGLERKGLIDWEHGKRGKSHSPTKIRRMVPIPHPPVN